MIDWTKPLEMHDGTPVKLAEKERTKAGTWMRVLVPNGVQGLNYGTRLFSPNTGRHINQRDAFVRNRIMTNIDTTKPLRTTDNRTVTFITMTSEGHILVDLSSANGFTPGWIIFDKDGQFVRSGDGSGRGLQLAPNVDVEKTVVIRMSAVDGKPSYHTSDPSGNAVAAIEVKTVNGIAVSAKLLRPNKIPFRRLPTNDGLDIEFQ